MNENESQIGAEITQPEKREIGRRTFLKVFSGAAIYAAAPTLCGTAVAASKNHEHLKTQNIRVPITKISIKHPLTPDTVLDWISQDAPPNPALQKILFAALKQLNNLDENGQYPAGLIQVPVTQRVLTIFRQAACSGGEMAMAVAIDAASLAATGGMDAVLGTAASTGISGVVKEAIGKNCGLLMQAARSAAGVGKTEYLDLQVPLDWIKQASRAAAGKQVASKR